MSAGWLVACALSVPGCGSPPDPGQLKFLVQASPPPDDRLLSPLTDPRVSALELRDAKTDQVLTRSRFDPAPAGQVPSINLDLGNLAISAPRDLRLLALGAAGQQSLGLSLYRQASWAFGEQKEILLQLRRPLAFFGGSSRLVAPVQPMDGGKPAPYFAPNQQLSQTLSEHNKLRVIDPNSVNPLLSSYDAKFDDIAGLSSPITAAAGTFDGQALLVASLAGKLHVVDTLGLQDQGSLAIDATLPVQSIVVDPDDKVAAVLHHAKVPPLFGRTGRILVLRDLPGLRARVSDGQPLPIDVDSSAAAPVAPPIAAAFSPDGQLEVLHAVPPLLTGQPDCTTLGGAGKSLLRRYSMLDGTVISQESLPYTTALSYTSAGERVLVQPCTQAANAQRAGQILVRRKDGDQILSAPGVAQMAVVGGALISVGAEDIPDAPTTSMRAAVRILEPNTQQWATSYFDLPAWQIPWRITLGIPHALNIFFAPTDVMAYGMAVTPDRARALVLLRVQHRTYPGKRGVYLYDVTSPTARTCYIKWSGYTYHVVLVNLQSGSREQDYMVGMQTQSCSSTFYDDVTGADLRQACFASCDPAYSNPFLIGYEDGYIPSAASVLFGRR